VAGLDPGIKEKPVGRAPIRFVFIVTIRARQPQDWRFSPRRSCCIN